MLTKAILTGGLLSVLAGSIVYFGTEGADALEVKVQEDTLLESSELAGAAEIEGVKDDSQDPPKEQSKTKPKKKWLDQYLKRSKDETEPVKEIGQKTEPKTVTEIDIPVVEVDGKDETRIKTRILQNGRDGEAKGTYIVSKDARVETLDVDGLDIDALRADGEIDVDILKEQLGIDQDKNVEVRVIKKTIDGDLLRSRPVMADRVPVDYGIVLTEAKKLLVTDMRNQAVLEIVDYAIDNGDMTQAADLVEELSTPELRDTARARIGTGLAKNGKTDAAFAVLDELEIDELAAPIRLEIITALMATKMERKAQSGAR